MAIDPSIYAQLLRPVKSIAEYDAEALQGQRNRLALMDDQNKFEDRARSIADGNKLRQIVAGFGTDTSANKAALLSAGRLDQALKYDKSNADIEKTRADANKSDANATETHLKSVNLKLGQAKDVLNTMQTPEQAASWVRGMYSDEDLAQVFKQSGDTPEAAISRIPTDPKAFQQWKMQASLGADKLIEYTTPNANTVASNEQSNANSIRSAASSKYSADSSAATARRGQDLTDARSREQIEAGKTQIVQSDAGPLMVNMKTSQSKAVIGPDGQPVGPKLKDIPAPIRKTMMENDASLRKVNDALAAIKEYPDALGVKNYLGDTVRQRSDPKGIKARALVADIGSLKIHDRSGAAVTASETPRLKPFIPSATDDYETVVKKLGLFSKEYNAIQADLRATYSRDQGYRAPADNAGLPDDIAALVAKHGVK